MNLDNGLTPAPGTPWAREFLRLLAASAVPPLRRDQIEALASRTFAGMLAVSSFATAAHPDESSGTRMNAAQTLGTALHETATALLVGWPEDDELPPDEADNLAFMAAIKEIR